MSYHGYSSSSSSNSSSNTQNRSSQRQAAPAGFHYMPNGTLMADSDMVEQTSDDLLTTITAFNLDLSDIPAEGESRSFEIIGGSEVGFRLEVKDNTTGYYYNFVTKLFQANKAFLNENVGSVSYKGSILFPSVTGSDDQYDIFLFASPNSRHAPYKEVRFGDGSLDINNSIGSNSLLMQKVIYQYAALTLTLQGYSAGSSLAGTFGTDTIAINRGKSIKSSFSLTTTAATTAAYRILKSLTANEILSFSSPVVGSAPVAIAGENIYPAVTGTDTVNGARDASAVAVTMDSAVATKMAVGDRVTGNTALNAGVFTVVSLDSTNVFSISSAVAIANGITLSFSNQMNYKWPINNFANKLKQGMSVEQGTNVAANTIISNYKDILVTNQNTVNEKYIVQKSEDSINILGKKPTVVKGEVTVQEGNIIFNKQQKLALAGDTLNIGGYGENQIFNLYGWDVKFTNLNISLQKPTTTTTEATAAHAVIAVADREGVINNFSTVSGIGIDPSVKNPTITAGGGADGAGDWTMETVQTLENGTTLTIENTSRVATITGNIEVVKAGTASQTIRFDVNKLLSTSA